MSDDIGKCQWHGLFAMHGCQLLLLKNEAVINPKSHKIENAVAEVKVRAEIYVVKFSRVTIP